MVCGFDQSLPHSPGDWVLSRNQYDATGNLELRQVTQVFIHAVDALRILEIQGDDGNVETIRTTDVHPFFAEGRGWIKASELQVGDRVQETDGTWQSILSTVSESHPEGFTVYNLEVGGDHTYFVEDGFGAADAVWVHNANDCAGNLKGLSRNWLNKEKN